MSERIDLDALAHRDYELVDPAPFTSYTDRIEIVSPGSLPIGVTLEDLRTRTVAPRWRNQALPWFLARLQLAQAEGQDIQTIRRSMKAAGCPPPLFDATEVSVTCVLRAHPRFGIPACPKKRVAKKASKARPRPGAAKKAAKKRKKAAAKTRRRATGKKTSPRSRGRRG